MDRWIGGQLLRFVVSVVDDELVERSWRAHAAYSYSIKKQALTRQGVSESVADAPALNRIIIIILGFVCPWLL